MNTKIDKGNSEFFDDKIHIDCVNIAFLACLDPASFPN